MKQQSLFTEIIIHKDEQERKLLLAAIARKKAALEKLVIKTETLKVRLDMVKEEYTVKIGSLVLKDNSLDLRIIYYQHLLRLVKDCLTYEEALAEVSQTYVAEEIELEKEREKIREEQREFEKHTQEMAPELLDEAKKLWKKLIRKFHPDLTQDPQEKKQREEIVKQINKAYKAHDLDALAHIERDQTITADTSSMRLEDILVALDNELAMQDRIYADLKDTEWYRWDRTIKKTKKTLSELFSGMERSLLDDIVAKLEIIKALEEEAATYNSPKK